MREEEGLEIRGRNWRWSGGTSRCKKEDVLFYASGDSLFIAFFFLCFLLIFFLHCFVVVSKKCQVLMILFVFSILNLGRRDFAGVRGSSQLKNREDLLEIKWETLWERTWHGHPTPTATRGGSHIYICISFSGNSRLGTRQSGGGFGLS